MPSHLLFIKNFFNFVIFLLCKKYLLAGLVYETVYIVDVFFSEDSLCSCAVDKADCIIFAIFAFIPLFVRRVQRRRGSQFPIQTLQCPFIEARYRCRLQYLIIYIRKSVCFLESRQNHVVLEFSLRYILGLQYRSCCMQEVEKLLRVL